MQRKTTFLFFGFLLGIVNLNAQVKLKYEHPIPFTPEQYICYQNSKPIEIDGKLDEEDWGKATWTKDFVDIEGELKPKPPFRTRAKMLWDEENLYIAAELEEPHVWAKLKQRDTVIFLDDDFEVFIQPPNAGSSYYEFEVNAFNTVWDLLMLRPYRDTIVDVPHYLFNWNVEGWESAVNIEGTINEPKDKDQGWTVEMAIPWSALKELARPKRGPRDGEYWRINFSRVDWHMATTEKGYSKEMDTSTGKAKREENWVWSPVGKISMHMPEHWGYILFSEQKAGTTKVNFPPMKEEKIKWALWQLFYQQHEFWGKNRRFSSDKNNFTLPEVDIPGYQFKPVFFTTPSNFEILAPSLTRGIYWRINQEGRIIKK